MASLKNTTVDDTGFIKFATGTQAERPGSPTQGMMRFNTTTSVLEFWNGTTWVGIGLRDGASIGSAADSADAIKTLTGTTSDGFYWILNNGVATNVWCDMNNNGGGWMMIARLHTDNSQWQYDNGIWTNSTLLNETQNADFGGHIKTSLYPTRAFTQVRIAMNTRANGIVETGWGTTNFSTRMGSGINSANSRATWINWINAAIGSSPSWLVNCNQFGINRAFLYQYARLGGTVNGENDCNSNDESFGFGLRGISPYGNAVASGAYSPYTGIGTPLRVGWIFIK
jgi:hypothetical protein